MSLSPPSVINITTGNDIEQHENLSLPLKEPLAVPPLETWTVTTDESSSLVSMISDGTPSPSLRVHKWNQKKFFSDYVREGLDALQRDADNTIMLFESPSSANKDSNFYNCAVYKFHDYPPASNAYKKTLGPCRYSVMNGNSFPSFLEAGNPPKGLINHWKSTIPGFVRPSFVSKIDPTADIYAYLPCESITRHVNDPHVHYHLAGKDALHLMTDKTTKLLQSTKLQRPCVVKTTHSMASKGIFIIRDDNDEEEFQSFLKESGNPTYVVTEYVDIDRNVACHFFIHPTGEVTWFGSNENYKDANGCWSMDTIIFMKDQDTLKDLQLPFVKDVVQYCRSLGFWGFCGVDVLFDKSGKGYVVDLNPRVTGSLPALMVGQMLEKKHGFDVCLFRRNGSITYHGSEQDLLDFVADYNEDHQGISMIVLFGIHELSANATKVNIGIYGNDMDQCRALLESIVHES